MNKFFKSLMIGVVASLVIVGGVAGVGIYLSKGADDQISASGLVNDDKQRQVRMRPQQVQIGGYSLNSKQKAKVLMVSVAMNVTGSHNQLKVCRLMPRLVSTVNTAFANLANYGDAQISIPKDLPGALKNRFNRALGENLVDSVVLSAHQDDKTPPATNCPEET